MIAFDDLFVAAGVIPLSSGPKAAKIQKKEVRTSTSTSDTTSSKGGPTAAKTKTAKTKKPARRPSYPHLPMCSLQAITPPR